MSDTNAVLATLSAAAYVVSGGEGDDSLQGDTVVVPGGTRSLLSNHGTTPVEMHGGFRPTRRADQRQSSVGGGGSAAARKGRRPFSPDGVDLWRAVPPALQLHDAGFGSLA